jgi:hypothetical protein
MQFFSDISRESQLSDSRAASTFSKSACMKADSTTSPIGIVFFPLLVVYCLPPSNANEECGEMVEA